MAGAPKGNRNGAKGRAWLDALRKALAQYEWKAGENNPEVKRGEALHVIAREVVRQAILGSKDAIAEIANRLDGKPTEYVEGSIHHTYAKALSDDELADIASGSSSGVADPQESEANASSLH